MGKWNTERWSEVSPYLSQALELEGDERREWLDDLAASRPELAVQLRGLLSWQEVNRVTRFLEHPPLSSAALYEPQAGERVGPYTLGHLLGRGGMGSVWLARRSDGRFEGKVAIKILSHCGFGPDAATQLRREASLLARLSHPNVARLLDAGIRDDGRAFLILEYVAGERIDKYCRHMALASAARLRLLLPVLEAVAHAHRHGIVHRDLKPSNILVTPEEVPKLLDFGVASLQPERSGGNPEKRQRRDAGQPEMRTEAQSVPATREPAGMTPGYAAPEQIRGEVATAASDVYALGVLLHLLITDRHPHGAEDSSPTRIIHATLTADCERASDSVASSALRRWVRGDLDAIIAKAMQRDPAARYANASQLAEDLRRFLDARPVLARVRTPRYRVALALRRLGGWQPGALAPQRRAREVLLVGVLLLSLAGGTLWLGWWSRGTPARTPASPLIEQRSIAVLPFNDLSDTRDEEYFSDGLSGELIDRLAQVPDLRVIARTSSWQFKGKEADVRAIARTLGVGYLLAGSVRKSGTLLRIAARLIRAADGSQVWAQSYDLNLDDVFKLQSDMADSVARALNLAPRNAAATPELPGPKVAAYNLVLQGNFFKARATRLDIEKAMSLYNQAIGLDPRYALPWALLGECYYLETEREWIDRVAGLELARAALARSLQMDPKLVRARHTLANMHMEIDFDWAAAYSEIEHMRQSGSGDSAPLLEARADIEADFGRLEQAITLYRTALKTDPLNTVALSGLAYTQSAAGKPDEALATLRRLLELAPDFAGARAQLSLYLLFSGKPTDALAALQQERDANDRMFALPIVYWASGQHDASNAALSRLKEKRAGSDAYGIACVYAYRGEVDLAMQWLDRAYRQRDMSLGLMKIDPLLHNLHGDPRYQALLRELRLTPEVG